MKLKNIISIFLASFLTTALIVVAAGMGVPDNEGFLYAFNLVPVIQNTINSDGTFTISYLPQVVLIFGSVVILFAGITLLLQHSKKK